MPARRATSRPDPWEAISKIERSQERIATVLDAVSARLEHVEKALPSSALFDQSVVRLKDLEVKVNEASKPNYTALGFGLSVIVALGTLVSVSINGKIDGVGTQMNEKFIAMVDLVKANQHAIQEHKDGGHPHSVLSEIHALEKRLDVQRDTHAEQLERRLDHRQREYDKHEVANEKHFDRIKEQILTLRENIVPRVEYTESQKLHDDRDAVRDKRIDTMDERLRDVEKRTGTLFKGGNPY